MLVINLDYDALVSRAAKALRPFRNIDLPAFAQAILFDRGFPLPHLPQLTADAVRVEQLRRSVMK